MIEPHKDHSECIMAECAEAKKLWLVDVKKHFPIGSHVHIVGSDLDEYIGATGKVRDYDLGVEGDYPLISVKFDVSILVEGEVKTGDSFYETELKANG